MKQPGEYSLATVEERVRSVVQRVLGVDPGAIRRENSFRADLGAESIQSVELVAAFEEEFGIEMNEEDALAVGTVGAAEDFITRACKDQGVEA